MKKAVKRAFNIVIALLVTAILLYFLLSKTDIGAIKEVLYSIPLTLLLVSVVLYLVMSLFRALRFHLFLSDNISLPLTFGITILHSAAVNFFPARLGELVYIYLLKREKIRFTKSLSSLFVVRIFDFIIICVLFFFSVIFLKGIPYPMNIGIWVIAAFLFLLILLLIILLFLDKKVMGLANAFLSAMRLNKIDIVQKIVIKFKETLEDIKSIKSKRLMLRLFVYSVLVWCTFYFIIYLIFSSLSLGLEIFQILVIATFTVLSSFLFIYTIAGFGVLEGVLTTTIVLFGVELEKAVAAAFVFHILVLFFVIVSSFFGFAFYHYSKRSSHPGNKQETL